MKKGFYKSLAVSNIRKNRKLYYPYFLSCVLMICIFYIISYLSFCDPVRNSAGGANVAVTLVLGLIVMGIFSYLFLNYTNSFLMKRREKEYGLYSVLGMNKRNIARIIAMEMLIISTLALTVGLLAGISLSKLFELAFFRIIGAAADYSFQIPVISVVITVIVYAVLFTIISLVSIIKISTKNAVEIIRSDSVGEKAPKANWLLGSGGIGLLAFAYIIALKCTSPLAALILFFVAVIMVIIATYMIFISGSVLLVSVLQKKKNFYYKTRNFISLSSLRFRMKRNGSGLASICILSTMLLVTMTTTSCMYFGQNDSLKRLYPRDFKFQFDYSEQSGLYDEALLKERDERILRDIPYENMYTCNYIYTAGLLQNGVLQPDNTAVDITNLTDFANVRNVMIYSTTEYNRFQSRPAYLADDEALVYVTVGKYKDKTFKLAKGDRTYKIVGQAVNIKVFDDNFAGTVVIVVNNPEELLKAYLEAGEMKDFSFYHNLLFDVEGKEQQVKEYYMLAASRADEIEKEDCPAEKKAWVHLCGWLALDAADFYGTYGSLFFVGILLSFAFLIITVMIIYYKQISEGYEDVSKFEIMRKVGINSDDVRESINAQMKMVFFSPVVMAVMHLLFAFTMIRGILFMFNINNLPLLIKTTAVFTLLFVVFYILVYRFTANTYYGIVSAKSND